MTLLEAQAAGLPVVAGNGGGVAAVVADGQSGLLSPLGDAAAFGQAVRTLLDDPARRVRMGEVARNRVVRQHDLPVAARSLDAALGSLAATAKRCA